MSEFLTYLEIGLWHVLDIGAYDHILFLMALTIPYSFRDWRKILLLVTIFTVGHTLALLLSVFGILMIDAGVVEFLIPITILATAVFNLFTAGKSARKDNMGVTGVITLFFGLIHGLGFSNYFKAILPGSAGDKVVPLFEFALGIELAQIAVVLAVLMLSFIVQNFFRNPKRDFTLILSSIIIGIVLPMIIESEIWYK